jgi:hypothetical protein
MKNFPSIYRNQHEESTEGDALIKRPTISPYSDVEATKNYESFRQDHHDESSEGGAPIDRHRSSWYKRYSLLAVIALGFLLVALTYNLQGASQVMILQL